MRSIFCLMCRKREAGTHLVEARQYVDALVATATDRALGEAGSAESARDAAAGKAGWVEGLVEEVYRAARRRLEQVDLEGKGDWREQKVVREAGEGGKEGKRRRTVWVLGARQGSAVDEKGVGNVEEVCNRRKGQEDGKERVETGRMAAYKGQGRCRLHQPTPL